MLSEKDIEVNNAITEGKKQRDAITTKTQIMLETQIPLVAGIGIILIFISSIAINKIENIESSMLILSCISFAITLLVSFYSHHRNSEFGVKYINKMKVIETMDNLEVKINVYNTLNDKNTKHNAIIGGHNKFKCIALILGIIFFTIFILFHIGISASL